MRLALSLVLLVACAAAPPVRTFAPPDQAAVTTVLAQQAAAWNRGDLAGYMEGYAHSDALVFTSGGKVRTGWQAAFDTYRAKYQAQPGSMGKLSFEVLRVDAAGGDAAIVLGRWTLTESPHDGGGIFSLVFARRPEGWRIVHDHTSADAP